MGSVSFVFPSLATPNGRSDLGVSRLGSLLPQAPLRSASKIKYILFYSR